MKQILCIWRCNSDRSYSVRGSLTYDDAWRFSRLVAQIPTRPQEKSDVKQPLRQALRPLLRAHLALVCLMCLLAFTTLYSFATMSAITPAQLSLTWLSAPRPQHAGFTHHILAGLHTGIRLSMEIFPMASPLASNLFGHFCRTHSSV